MEELKSIVAEALDLALPMLAGSEVSASLCTGGGGGAVEITATEVPLNFERSGSNIRFGMRKWLVRASEFGATTPVRGQFFEVGLERLNVEAAQLDPTGNLFTIYLAPPNIAGALWRREFGIPAMDWNWTHNLGYVPVVEVYDSDWNPMLSPVVNVDENSVSVQHTFNATGWVVLVTNGV